MLPLFIQNYKKQLEIEYKNISPVNLEESEKALNLLNQTQVFAMGQERDINKFHPKIQKALKKISQLQIGQLLLNNLIKYHQGSPVKIETNFTGSFYFSSLEKKLVFDSNIFIVIEDENKKKTHRSFF